MEHIESDIKAAETELDDDAESIITNERYVYIALHHEGLLQEERAPAGSPLPIRSTELSPTAWLGLPIFAAGHVPCLLHLNGRPSALPLPTGQTTACSVMAGTCSGIGSAATTSRDEYTKLSGVIVNGE